MQLSHLVAAGLAPAMASALSRRAIHCSYSTDADDGSTCDSFASAWGITAAHLTALNPGIACPNLDNSQSYCVFGTVTDEAEPEAAAQSTTLRTVATPTTTTAADPSHSPTMPGIAANCDGYHKVVAGDQCNNIAARYHITVPQLRSWNSQINADCTNLWLDYYICIHVPTTTTTTQPTPTSDPSPKMPGIVTNCKAFYEVTSGDTCYSIARAHGISFDQLRAWNTALDSGCTNLWLGYYICVGI